MVAILTPTNGPVGAEFRSQTISLAGGGLATASTVMREVPIAGSAGGDQFRFGAGSGHDIVLDFEYGVTGDRILVDVAGDGSLNGTTIPNAAALFDAAEDYDNGVLIGLGEGHSILLAWLVKADLGADMFLLA